MRQRRAFARDDEQRIGPARAHAHEHAQQEIDVLFEGHAPHVQQQRTVRRQVELLAEARAVTAHEALGGQTRGQHFDGRGDAIGRAVRRASARSAKSARRRRRIARA